MQNIQAISSQAEFETLTQDKAAFVFKFSNRCPISHYAEAQCVQFASNTSPIPCYSVDVIGARPLSQWIASNTGIKHESPQALLFKDGKVVWSESHAEINTASLLSAIETYCKA